MKHLLHGAWRIWIATVVIIAAVLGLGWLATVGAKEVWGVEAREVLTGSMVPTYPVGSIVWYGQPTGADLLIQRAVGVEVDGAFVTHRVVAIEDGFATLKGDANENADVTKVTQANVKAIPFAVTTGTAAVIVKAVLTPSTAIVAALVVVITLVLDAIGKAVLNRRDQKRYERQLEAARRETAD